MNRGSVFLIVLVGLAMVGFIAASYAVTQGAIRRDIRVVQLEENKVALQNWFKTGHDCGRTVVLNPGTCGTTYIDLGRKGIGTPPPLIDFEAPADFKTVVGDYRMRAVCSGTAPKVIAVEYQSLTDRPTSNSWRNLFPKEAITCF